MATKALQLKEEGNQHWQAGNFIGAETCYSKAIIADPKNPALYTNRAMARLKLGYWDLTVTDCQHCLAIMPDSMKATYYLSQAQLALHDYDAAVGNALKAHRLCADAGDKSLAIMTSHVLNCKKERWDDREKRRTREARELEVELVSMLARDRDAALAGVETTGQTVERAELEKEWQDKIKAVEDMFERARGPEDKRREVPEWVIDDISFGIMVDPVITKNGKSYERASIREHLRRHQMDPMTREPLTVDDLRPNRSLRQACEQFLDENGWAVDW